jgi:hypothetical protein
MANLGTIGIIGGQKVKLTKASTETNKRAGTGIGVNLLTVGNIAGQKVKLTKATVQLGWTYVLYRPRMICIGGGISDRLWFGSKNTTDGSASQPCLDFSDCNALFRFRWAVTTGTRTLSVKCANISGLTPYPTVTIRANKSIGVNSDVVGTAIAGTGWQTIGPLSVSPSSNGVLLVELYSGGINGSYVREVRWDTVTDSTGRIDTLDSWLNNAPVIDINEVQSGPAVTRTFGSVG